MSIFLVRALKAKEQIDKVRLERLTKGFFSKATLYSIEKSLKASDQIEKMLSDFQKGGIAAEAIRASEKLNQDLVFDQNKKLSEQLGVPNAGNTNSNFGNTNQRLGEFVLPFIPPNPVYETNKRLDAVIGQMEKAVLVSNATSKLIANVHDTAIKIHSDYTGNAVESSKQTNHAIIISKRIFFIAIIGFIASSGFSIWTLLDARERGEKAEQQVKLLHEEIKILFITQREDRLEFANTLRKLMENRKAQETSDRNKVSR